MYLIFLLKKMSLLTNIMIGISALGSLILIVPALLVIGFVLLKQKKKELLALLVCGLFGGLLLTFIIKNIIQRPRPPNSLVTITGYSFPSGHAVQSLIFYSLLIFIFRDQIKNRILKYFFILSNILIILLIGLSRIYLRVHWVSDVKAGYVLGIAWLIICMLGLKKVHKAFPRLFK